MKRYTKIAALATFSSPGAMSFLSAADNKNAPDTDFGPLIAQIDEVNDVLDNITLTLETLTGRQRRAAESSSGSSLPKGGEALAEP